MIASLRLIGFSKNKMETTSKVCKLFFLPFSNPNRVMVTQLITNERIQTGVTKAKELQKAVDLVGKLGAKKAFT